MLNLAQKAKLWKLIFNQILLDYVKLSKQKYFRPTKKIVMKVASVLNQERLRERIKDNDFPDVLHTLSFFLYNCIKMGAFDKDIFMRIMSIISEMSDKSLLNNIEMDTLIVVLSCCQKIIIFSKHINNPSLHLRTQNSKFSLKKS